MHDRTSRSARPRLAALALVMCTVALVLIAAVAGGVAAASSPEPSTGGVASGSPAPVASDAAPAEAGSPQVLASPDPSSSPEPTVITCALSQAAIVFGGSVTVSGVVTPALEGQQVAIALDGADLGTTTTDATGAYSFDVTPKRSGSIVARVVSDGTVSEAQEIAVKPDVTITHGAVVPFLRARFVVKVAPSAYDGVISVKIEHRGAVLATIKKRVVDGKAVVKVPLRGVGGFTLTFVCPAAGKLAARSVQVKVTAKSRRLAVGSTGAHVKGLLNALSRLKIRIPGSGSRFTTKVKDSVMAFQKAYRLPRTYVFDGDDWRKLDTAKTIKPRYSSPATHLEVDKGRQILMVVKNGAVAGLICVSTGATGNTPEGSFHIQQKHSFTTSGYGGILVRTMGFIGDFAIHGYAPVPPYPASHGCIREPIWACYWVYDQSFVGERLYVYH